MKINKLIYGMSAITLLGSVIGINSHHNEYQAQASKIKITSIKVLKYYTYNQKKYTFYGRGKSGNIYGNLKFTKSLGNLKQSRFKNKWFKIISLVKVRVNHQTFMFDQISGNGIKGYVESYQLKTKSTVNQQQPSSSASSSSSAKSTSSSQTSSSSSTNSQSSQSETSKVNNNQRVDSSLIFNTTYDPNNAGQNIQKFQQQAQSIGNGSTDGNIYNVMPSFNGSFIPGQLNPSFINNTVSWINFFRGMYGLSPVTNNDAWNVNTQIAAADLDAANQGLSHGLHFAQPSVVPNDAWKIGQKITNSSNLSQGTTSPYDTIVNYLNDSGNAEPGHRDWILGGLKQVGVGQAGEYENLMVIGNDSPDPEKNIEYPKADIFPYALVKNTYWSLALKSRSFTGTPTVTIKDNTTGANVPVYNTHTYNDGYGYFKDALAYQPDSNGIQSGHTYTITITNIPKIGTYTYTTTLFNLGIGSEFF